MGEVLRAAGFRVNSRAAENKIHMRILDVAEDWHTYLMFSSPVGGRLAKIPVGQRR